MIVLKIIGWIILAVLALILFVLCIKVKISAEYSDENTFVALKWLFLTIPLYPKEKKEKKEEKEEKPEEKPNEKTDEKTEEESEEKEEDSEDSEETSVAEVPEKPEKKKESLLHILYRTNGIDGLLLIIGRVFSYLGTFIGDFLKSLVIEEFYLDARCSKKDAAETAIYYGKVCSSAFPMLGAIASKCKLKKYDINIYPDFLAPRSSASFAITFHLYPIYVIAISVVFLCRLIFKVVLRLIGKIFLSGKKDKTENKNTKIKEK